MAGTAAGSRKLVRTIYTRYGIRYFELLGRSPKPKGRGAGFAANPELARIAGRKGGKASRRRKVLKPNGTRAWRYLDGIR